MGKTSGRPREGAPEGPGETNFPSKASNTPDISNSPLPINFCSILFFSSSSTLLVLGKFSFGSWRPETSSSANNSRRSRVSSHVRQILFSKNLNKIFGLGPVHSSAGSMSSGSNSPNFKSLTNVLKIECCETSFSPLGTLTRAKSKLSSNFPFGVLPKT